jgi:hypothetical protein
VGPKCWKTSENYFDVCGMEEVELPNGDIFGVGAEIRAGVKVHATKRFNVYFT